MCVVNKGVYMSSVNFKPNVGSTNNQAKPKKAKKSNDFIQTQVACMAGGTVSGAVSLANMPVMNKMLKINHAASAEKSKDLFEAAKQALVNSGVADKVKIHTVSEKDPLSFMAESMIEGVEKLKLPKKIKEFFKSQNPEYAIFHGKNACFNPATQKVIYNPEKMGLSAFHEIGHAMNFNLSKVGKALQSMRTPGMALAGTFMLLGVAAKSKSRVEHDKQQNNGAEKKGFAKFKEKTMSFFRDNAGKLSFAAMIPVIAEEAMATVKGNKLAKSLLSPEMLKKVKTANALGLATYTIGAIATGVGAYAAVKIKDKLVANKIAKQEAKAQQAQA